jgi:O-antigen ligase
MSAGHAASTWAEAKPARGWLPIAAAVSGIVVALAASQLVGSEFGVILFVGVVVLALGLWGITSPINSTFLLLVVLFMRQPLKSVHVPTNLLFKIVLGLVIVATVLWIGHRGQGRLRGIGPVEWAMTLYLLWNVYSMLAPHEYSPGPLVPGGNLKVLPTEPFSVSSFIGFAAVVPFVFYFLGRYTFDRTAAVRTALWAFLALAAYSAAMSILPFTGPTTWVWPQYILHDPNWSDRAVGVFAQPVENGMVLALGFAVALLLLSRPSEPTVLRLFALMVAPACLYGIYLTHTRAIWLSALVMLIIGAALAKGFRTGFIAALCLVIAMVIVKWSAFSSAKREAGGVASVTEIQDRLNINQTALWAATQKPLTGWGIGRFYAVNTYHHQQWSLATPWIRGYGDSAHLNELGILAELGLIGLAFWICVLVLIARQLWRAYRTLPNGDLCGQPLVVVAIIAFAILLSNELGSDLRFYGFPIAAIFLIVGIAVGWSDPLRRPPPLESAEQLPRRHA